MKKNLVDQQIKNVDQRTKKMVDQQVDIVDWLIILQYKSTWKRVVKQWAKKLYWSIYQNKTLINKQKIKVDEQMKIIRKSTKKEKYWLIVKQVA